MKLSSNASFNFSLNTGYSPNKLEKVSRFFLPYKKIFGGMFFGKSHGVSAQELAIHFIRLKNVVFTLFQ